jgi:CHASE3 domain sensor protein
MRFSLSFRIAAAFFVSLISLVALATISYRNVAALNREAEWVTHTFEVLQTKEALKRSRAEMEAGARGYAITGQAAFREQASAGGAEMEAQQRKLLALTTDNPGQHERITRLSELLAQRRALVERLLQVRAANLSPTEPAVQELVNH